jgi:copper(I)-binding protein
MMKQKVMPMLALLAVCAILVLQAQAPPLRVENAWMRQPPLSSATAAAHGVLVNESDRPVTIVAATSKAFKTIEFHEMSMHRRHDAYAAPRNNGRPRESSSGLEAWR